jgi:hypothetical protein
LTSKGITVMPQPPYSPDLVPCDFALFQKAKSAVKGHHFESTEDIQRSVTQALNDIPQAAFQECYRVGQNQLDDLNLAPCRHLCSWRSETHITG